MTNAGRVLMIPKGEYNSATTYEMLDFVYYQGRSYVCKQTSTGNAPTNTTYWQALTGADADKMDATNPTGTGSFSLNRKASTTVGNYSFAEGTNCTASGEASHAEGQDTTASGNYSHAEGTTNVASGYGSHAEGLGVTASGIGCHAEGNYTIAGRAFQHVCGKNNDNKANTLFEVGNGGDPEADRSNAFEVYSDGSLSTDNGTTKVKLETLVSQNQALSNYVDTEVVGARNYLDITLDSIKSANTDGTWNGNTYTLSGVTVTVSADAGGRVDNIALVGLASTTFFFTVLSKTNLLTLPFATILNGGFTATSGANALRALSEDGATAYSDLGTGVEIPANFPMWVQIRLSQGTQAAFNVKPMIRKATDTNAEYVKYPDTLQTLTQNVTVSTDNAGTGLDVKRYGKVVTINIDGEWTVTQNQFTALGVLHEGYRPSVDIWGVLMTGEANMNALEMRVRPSGSIEANGWQLSGTLTLRGSVTYITP